MTAGPVATVVIVNYNGAHLLPACLDALDEQRATAPPFETIVVDNASVDDSTQLLVQKYPWVRVVSSRTNLGFAGGNNLALRGATAPFAVLLNNDAAPEPGWLANLLAPFSEPGAEKLAIVTGKVVFMPRFIALRLETEAFRPGPLDARDLGVRVYRVTVDGSEVTSKVMWERVAYGLEGAGEQQFRWTRPAGDVLVPLPAGRCPDGVLTDPAVVTVSVAAERTKSLRLGGTVSTVDSRRRDVVVEVPVGARCHDVINNAGGIVLRGGYGADRGFEEIDAGQYDHAAEVFTGCGNGMAIRTEVGAELGWFDDDFFMYYEDTDLSWRARSAGWSIRYQPDAVLRHIHSASSLAWSPRWVFHVDRNRMLILTKNATARLAGGAALRYPLTTLSMAAREVLACLRFRRRPRVAPVLLRVRVFGSYLRLLPRVLARRVRIGRAAVVGRAGLETWLVDSR